MKRELKFRAWDGEEMLYEFSVQSNGDGVLYCGELTEWEIMQFVGLTDKNGVEIYEGDRIITRWPNAITGSVDELPYTISDLFDYEIMKEISQCDEIEVIGNIYEHPHLINKTEPA